MANFVIGVAASLIAVVITWGFQLWFTSSVQRLYLRGCINVIQRSYLRRAASLYMLIPAMLSSAACLICVLLLASTLPTGPSSMSLIMPNWLVGVMAATGAIWMFFSMFRWMGIAIEAEHGVDLENSIAMLAGVATKDEYRQLMQKKAIVKDSVSLEEFFSVYRDLTAKYGMTPVNIFGSENRTQ